MKNSKSILMFLMLPIFTTFAFTISFFIPKINSKSISELEFKNKTILTPFPKSMSCVVPRTAVVTAPELWSNPATWGGTKPVAGDLVTIDANKHIILDENPPVLSGLTINGKLEFARQNVSLTSQWIIVMGELHIGSVAAPFLQKATITLNGTDTNQSIMGMGTRGIMVMGGLLELHGNPPNKRSEERRVGKECW